VQSRQIGVLLGLCRRQLLNLINNLQSKLLMTFVEMLSLIGERNEKVYIDKLNMMRTDQRLYLRSGEVWEEKSLPPPEEDKFAIPSKPLEIPVQKKKSIYSKDKDTD